MHRLASTIALIALATVTALPALAAQPPYLDDRSTAAALVASFYNAVNRQEYARAYTYFGDNAPQGYDSFAAGYADTRFVRVTTGSAVSDGAAGSIFYTLPVVLDALQADGSHKRFAGCYTTRLVEPGIQEPPVTPMVIYRAKLQPVHADARLPTCEAD